MAVNPIVAGGVMAGLSILGDLEANSAIRKAAQSSYKGNKAFTERDQAVTFNQLNQLGQDVNRQLGAELTNLVFAANEANAVESVKAAESMAFGNTAQKNQAMTAMKAALAQDSLVQRAEAQMTDVQNQLTSAKYAFEAKHIQNLNNYYNAMSQQKTALQIGISALGSGLSGAATASGIK